MSETPDQVTRRRWISLAELVAVAGLLIGALTLWINWSDRRADEATKADERRAAGEAAAAEKRRVGLVATNAGGGSLAFKGVACALQATDISFPRALGVQPQFTVTIHEIQADWFAKPLLKLTDGGPDEREGRLPVLIASRCEGEDGARQETAIYDIAYRIEPRMLRSRTVELRGLVLREQALRNGQARLDAIWAQLAPRPIPNS
jgi:hypothetical protein